MEQPAPDLAPAAAPLSEAVDAADLMGRLYAMCDARMAIFMPELLALLGPGLLSQRLNHHQLANAFDSIASAAAAADRRYVRMCLRDNVDRIAAAYASEGREIPPVRPVPKEVLETLQGIADRFKDFCPDQ